MSLRAILLGLLDSPAAGYDLGKLFEETVRHFWRAELSQIYPTLHKLREDGLVAVSSEPSPQGPMRKVYRRTVAGTAALQEWIDDGPTLDAERYSWLAQVFFSGQGGDAGATRRLLRELRVAFGERLRVLLAIDAAHRQGREKPPDLTAENAGPYLTLRCGIRRIEATVAWCDESLALLDRLDAEAYEGVGTS